MAEISREYLDKKRAELEASIQQLQGALEMVRMITEELFPAAALTMQDLKELTGFQEIGEPERIDNDVTAD